MKRDGGQERGVEKGQRMLLCKDEEELNEGKEQW